jgi:polyhydroxyalkanoate synthesis regulator phasin
LDEQFVLKEGMTSMKISAEQAQYVLDTLVSQGRVKWAHIQKVLKGRLEEIRNLRARLSSLEKLVRQSAPARRGRRARKVVRRKMSSKTRALRRLQGKYMGHVRNLKAAEKARVKAVREKQGIGPAIKLAASLGSK